MNFEQLKDCIEEWGYEKGIIQASTPEAQLLKTMAELGELADGVNKKDDGEMIDGLGDTLVTLILFAKIQGLDLVNCLEIAYNEIRHRRGKMVGGVFVKDSSGE
jgi:NTP pyrophosphatase (non-canonical NTP hydrolase)